MQQILPGSYSGDVHVTKWRQLMTHLTCICLITSHVSVSLVGNAGVWVQAIVAHSEHDMVYVKDPACRSFSYDTLKLFTEIILENMPTGEPFCLTPFCLPLCMQPWKTLECLTALYLHLMKQWTKPCQYLKEGNQFMNLCMLACKQATRDRRHSS